MSRQVDAKKTVEVIDKWLAKEEQDLEPGIKEDNHRESKPGEAFPGVRLFLRRNCTINIMNFFWCSSFT